MSKCKNCEQQEKLIEIMAEALRTLSNYHMLNPRHEQMPEQMAVIAITAYEKYKEQK